MLKKVSGFLAVLLVLPVLAFATAEVTINDPLPLFCGTGAVPIGGLAYASGGEQYNQLKVYFGVAGQPLTNEVVSQTITQNATYQSWSTTVVVTQGTNYSIWATMKNASGTLGKAMLISKVVAKCNGQA